MDDQAQPIPIELDENPTLAAASPLLGTYGRPPHEFAQLARFLYNHNPFYVVSALCVFSGLWQSFSQEAALVEAGIIALGLAAYTLLLALTAWLIIRLGRVWDDARSILLIIVLMLLAISISSDPVLNAEEQHGTSFVLGGFLFAIAVSEGLLRSLPLRLPVLFRVPYYLTLALFFLYPLAMSPLLAHPPGPALYWALFGFSSVAGAIFLTLLSAVRRGANYVRDNGSPWRWPLFPWVLFGMLGLCACLRAYSLCVSFHPILGTESIFGWYFLIPFGLAITVLFVEAAVVRQSVAARRTVLILPVVMVVLSMAGHRAESIYASFLDRFTETLSGSPLNITLLAVTVLYGYAVARGIRGAGNFFVAALASLAFVTKYSVDLDSVGYQRAWPLLAAGAMPFATGVLQGSSRRATVGVALVLAPLALDLRFGWLGTYRSVVVFHVMLIAVLVLGAIFSDSFAQVLRRLGAVLLAAACVAPATVDARALGTSHTVLYYAYPLLPIIVALLYARFIGGPIYYTAAAAGAIFCPVAYSWHAYRHLRHQILGLDKIAWGVAFFVVAALVSLSKAGVWQRWRARRRAVE